jgi:hypothetical protein
LARWATSHECDLPLDLAIIKLGDVVLVDPPATDERVPARLVHPKGLAGVAIALDDGVVLEPRSR